ncbi:hypothetical protein HBI56_042290 [Parastagonospora nodorum]|uniref:Glucose-repressible alcohol dehydrogenase transcriptional effector n=2 Tax=Phaeosphaeria nodorum (strain SN15 / ATCC MYA-4574 / FGSC 10173) TaxID=321614 RepID=A0A7U2EUN3_PHANO|nr:hypothetical protein SNOG_03430 [Parastagonospora nodorum SN15]KAH3915756.1 hypothetical protein HBH56_064440 [Parastagonospora nodorum]EAT88635.1 hypothetical protein SNOG_03430 [Parastagonospora nodorum SN15]KAH3932632.1 hypothetical protein HBH54_083630 [Parastagonospora nodorum]KAH4005075.1 hypothetical protein HBI10_045570 [Parastagonospora nodorum]KAH4031122.1 hypothetical protein HBI13_029020 [Parastagonospora nodorum]
MDSDAVPPSSPPHATAPGSPFFEPRNTILSPKSSSPPPLFSSDDSRESADLVNYQSPRIFKNKRKGAWWDNAESSAHSTPEAKKTKMTRNFDSGVYMMSDATDSSDSLLPPHKPPFGLDGTVEVDPPELLSIADDRESMFCEKLYRGLDSNAQYYDFSDCDFEDRHIQRIGELSSVIKSVPDPGNDLPAEGQYRSMVPELYVDLNHNKLQHLTPSLFRVQNLTTLALIDNNIEELPVQISQLRRLRELNISRNHIQSLPFEMLYMWKGGNDGGLETLGDSGVQWLHPKDDRLEIPLPQPLRNFWSTLRTTRSGLEHTDCVEQLHRTVASMPDRDQHVWGVLYLEMIIFSDNPTQSGHTHYSFFDDEMYFMRPRCLAHSLVSYFDEAGSLIDGSPKPPSSEDDFATITNTARGAHGVPKSWFTPPHTKKTKSLLTLAIHSALRHKDQEDLTISDIRHHIGDPVPPVADAILKQAEQNSAGGYGEFKTCFVCKSDFVVARAEWIQWYCLSFGTGRTLPFKAQVCSWGCVPDAISQRPERLLSWD